MDKEIVQNAYDRLKKHIYYDTTNPFLRDQIVAFEKDNRALDPRVNLDPKFQEIADAINQEDSDYFNKYINDVSCWVLPKALAQSEHKDNSASTIIKNFVDNNDIEIDSVIKTIKIAIEIHILSVLWILKSGYKFVSDLDHSYGNMLVNEDILLKDHSKQLFKVYWGQYRSWRDGALKEAKRLHENNQNSVIIGLDIKSFYNSIELQEEEILSRVVDVKGKFLTTILLKLYKKYSNDHINTKENTTSIRLPIGILSSAILANWYLKKFDIAVLKELQPLYYGRYVDDILCVFNHNKLSVFNDKNKDKNKEQASIIKFFFKEQLKYNEEKNQYTLATNKELIIQPDKLSIMLFDHQASLSLLEKFEHEIRKSSSEFKLIQQEFSLEQEFNTSSLRILYDGPINKLRSIREFSSDKFGVASFLTKANYIALHGQLINKNIKKDILRFFIGRVAIDNYTLWEKAFAYFVITDDIESFNILVNELYISIKNVKKSDKFNSEELKKFLINFLKSTITYTLSIQNNLKFITESEINLYVELESIDSIFSDINNSKMLNDKYIRYSFSQLLEDRLDNGKLDIKSFTIKDPAKIIDTIKDKSKKLPRSVSLYEKQTYQFLSNLAVCPADTKNTSFRIIPFHDFGSKQVVIDKAKDDDYCSNDDCSRPNITKITIENTDFKASTLNKLKVGIANLEVKEDIFKPEHLREIKKNPFWVSLEWMRKILKIINQAVIDKVDLLVLPECSIPLGAIDIIIDKAKKEQIAMVFGLQHIINENDVAFNIQVVALPFKYDKYADICVDYRLKQHYSPEEMRKLAGYGYQIPRAIDNPKIYHWRGAAFSAFNCYEFADIDLRQRLISKIDMLIICEFNSDTAYFSNLVESASRDLHCYIVQVNSAQYGDSRVCSPASSLQRDIMKIKGGKNPMVIVFDIDIKALREFQVLNYELQHEKEDNHEFKPTPPGFDKEEVKKRLK